MACAYTSNNTIATWTNNNNTSKDVTVSTTVTDAEGIVLIGNSGSIKFTKNKGKITTNQNAEIYVPVPAGAAGKIEVTSFNSSGDSKYFQIITNTSSDDSGKRIWSKQGTNTAKQGPKEYTFTSLDLVKYNNSGSYIHLKAMGGNFGPNDFKVTLTTGAYGSAMLTLNPNGGDFASTPSGWTKSANAPYTYSKLAIVGTQSPAITLPIPEKSGSTFYRWEDAQGNAVTSISSVSAAATYTAKWKAAITYANTNGAANSNPTEYVEGVGVASFAPLDNVSGWNFTGWNETSIPASATGAKTITAQWEAAGTQYPVNFHNGESVSTVYVDENAYASVPASPVVNDINSSAHTYFKGWSLTEGGELVTVSSVQITEEKDFYAVWGDQLAVTYKNGETTIKTDYVIPGGQTAFDGELNRTGWALAGWTLNPEAQTIAYFNFTTAITEAITLHAVWTRENITIPGTPIAIINGTTVNTGGTLNVDLKFSTNSSNNHFKFYGAMSGTSGARYVSFTIPEGYTGQVTEALMHSSTIFVIIDAADFSTFNYNDPYFQLTGSNKTQADAAVNLELPAGTYYCGSTNSGLEISKLTVTITGSPIYATFMDGETQVAKIQASKNETLGNLFLNGALPVQIKAGHNFEGWFTEETAGTQVNAGTTISTSTTYYAQWTAKTTAITLDANGGTGSSVTATYGQVLPTFAAAVPADPTNYSLKGYYTAATEGVKIIESNGALIASTIYADADGKWINEDADLTLYAQYGENLNVKFYSESVQFGETVKVAEGGNAVAPVANPTKDGGYRFMGWSETEGGAVVDLGTITIDTDKDFYAVFEKEWTVTFNTNGGSAITEEKVLNGEVLAEPAEPTRANWTFDGWKKGDVAYDFAAPVGEDITLVAQWTRNTSLGGEETVEIIVSKDDAKSVNLTAPVYGYDQSYDGNATYVLTGGKTGGTSGKRYVQFTIPAGYTGVVYYDITGSNNRYGVIANSSQATNYSATNNVAYFVAPNYLYTDALPADTYYATSIGGGLTINKLTVTLTSVPVTVNFDDAGVITAKEAMVGETLGNLFLNGALPAAANVGGAGWYDADGNEVDATTVITGAMTLIQKYPITAITLDPASKEIEQGESFVITPIVTPTYATESIVWTTGDADIATVVDGEVTAVFVTKATENKDVTITATSASGTVNQTCEVTVTPSTLEEYTLTATEGTLLELADNQYLPLWLDGSQVGKTYVLYKDGVAINQSDKEGTGSALGWTVNAVGEYVVKVGDYPMLGTVTMVAAGDKALSKVVFSNGFDAFIEGNTVTAYYMAGAEAPTIANAVGVTPADIQSVVINEGKIVVTATDGTIKNYDLVLEAVAPLTTFGEEQTFDGSENYVKSAAGWEDSKGWKFQKLNDADNRETRGLIREYFFFGPAKSASFTWKVSKKNSGDPCVAKVYVNGVEVMDAGTDNFEVALNKDGNNIVAFVSQQHNGDCGFKAVTLNADYMRTDMLGAGVYGTICVDHNVPVNQIFGISVYEFKGRDANNYGKLVFDEIIAGEMEAGKPYVFQARGDKFALLYGNTSVDEPVNTNGMYGTFEDTTLTELTGVYYFAQRALWSCVDLTSLSVPANRAYVKLSELNYLDANNSSPAPGRRRIFMTVNGEQIATGVEDVQSSEIILEKVMIDGQLFIIRGEKVFDATGRLVK